jgi:hypothetical protein
MQSSRLPLQLWFALIRLLIEDPARTPAALAAATGHQRRGTLRRVSQKVRDALRSPRKTELLAGLDKVFEAGDQSLAESRAQNFYVSAKRTPPLAERPAAGALTEPMSQQTFRATSASIDPK